MPTTSYPDQCKCFACLKLFSDWEPDDDPWSCHCSNSPLCAFVCTTLEAHAERVLDDPSSASDGVSTLHLDTMGISRCDSLSSEVVSASPVHLANTSSELGNFIAAEGDGDDVLVSRVRVGSKSKVDRKRSGRIVETAVPNDEQQRAQQELSQIRFLVASSRHAAQQYWDQVATDVAVRVDHVSKRLNVVSERVLRLRGHDWLCGKREELQCVQEHICRLKAERADLENGNAALATKLEQCIDAASKLRELTVEVSELEHRKASAIESCRQLEDQIATCLTRIEVRVSR